MLEPEHIAFFIGALAFAGVVSSIIATHSVDNEDAQLKLLSDSMMEPTTWVHVFEMPAVDWLKKTGILAESHAADQLKAIRGCWGCGMLPSLGELHSLFARRERSRKSVRFANGLAASLLIIGIAGTLLGIHPLLTKFSINPTAEGTIDTSKNAQQVMDLVAGLGKAFLPSLIALFGTICIVIFRGFYVRAAQKLESRIDGFIVESLFPAFKPKSQEEVMGGVKQGIASLTGRIEARDNLFSNAVTEFGKIVESLKSVAVELNQTARLVSTAADNLGTNSESVSSALDRNFGESSVILKAVQIVSDYASEAGRQYNRLSDSSEELRNSVMQQSELLTAAAEDIKKATASASRKMASSADKLAEAAKSLPHELQEKFEEASKANTTASQAIVSSILKTSEDAKKSAEATAKEVSASVLRAGKSVEQFVSLNNAAAAKAFQVSLDQAISISKNKFDDILTNADSKISNQTMGIVNKSSEELISRISKSIDSVVDKSVRHLEATIKQAEDASARDHNSSKGWNPFSRRD
jgi:ABC-type transporter Mla subunit MlaD